MIHPGRYRCLGELLRDACVQFKTETALVEASRKREASRYSYRDFRRAALPVARRLERAGVGAGDRVAVLMTNQPRWLIGAYAAMTRGAVLVPLDYKMSPEDQAALLAHARPKALLVEYSIWRTLDAPDLPLAIVSEAPAGQDLGAGERWEDLPEIPPEDEPPLVMRERDDVACIVYSSGTSGRPKGCMLTHDAYLEQLDALTELYPMEAGDRYFSILPTNHAIDFMVGFVGPFTGGATVVHQRALRPEFIDWTMRRYRITHMAVVPMILEAFERRIRERLDGAPPLARGLVETLAAFNERLTQKRPNHALSRRLLKPVHDGFGGHLKLLFCGGAFVDRERAELFNRLGIPVVIGYGLTEACTVATVHDLKPFRADSVGRSVRGVEVRIYSPNDDGIGEVLIRGPTVMKGYLDDPALTEQTLRDGWLHTGDLGWMDAAGHLHLVGRSKNMFVTAGGKNIYPEDVEQTFEDVPCDELAVFASNYIWPGGARLDDEMLLAIVRAGEGDEPSVTEALARHNGRLPDYKRVRGVLLWDREFPRTASMKLKRNVLAEEVRSRLERDAVEPIRS